jgi:hypothetical protein
MDKKKQLITGISFGIGIAIFFILREILLNDQLTADLIRNTLIGGVLAGIVAGLLVVGFFRFFKK